MTEVNGFQEINFDELMDIIGGASGYYISYTGEGGWDGMYL